MLSFHLPRPAFARQLSLAVATAGLLATCLPAAAQQMVSIQGSAVNLRAGPRANAEVLWEVTRGYPLKVVGQQGRWLRVQDFENDRVLRTRGKQEGWVRVERETGQRGWVAKRLLWGW